jgi:hypothetical protein
MAAAQLGEVQSPGTSPKQAEARFNINSPSLMNLTSPWSRCLRNLMAVLGVHSRAAD